MNLVLLLGICAAAQADFSDRVQVRSGGGYSLVLLDDTVLYYGKGRKAAVGVQGTDPDECFITVTVDGVETVRLWAPYLDKPIDLPPAELPPEGEMTVARRQQDGKPWVHLHYLSAGGKTFGLYDGPGAAPVATKAPSVGKRTTLVVTVDQRVVYRAPMGSDAPPTSLSDAAVTSLAARYKTAGGQWTLQALILLALGESYPPSAAELLMQGLQAKDRRIRAYALETLARSTAVTLAAVATPEIVENLVNTQLHEKNPYYATRVGDVLRRLLPDTGKDLAAAWRKAKPAYATSAWEEPPRPPRAPQTGPGQTVAEGLINRAVDLNESGLEVAICIDTTGSMQPTIDAARDGLADIVAILRGVATQFRLGLVHYKDVKDMKEGAELLVPLTAAVEPVQKYLGTLKAYGGGDFPENVECGLAYSLHAQMGWKRGTSKLIVIVGDAPPHEKDMDACLQMAKAAREKPFGPKMVPTAPGTPAKDAVRPFVISTVGVGIAGRVQAETEEAFKKIAEAGGGSYGVFAVDAKAMIPGAPQPKPSTLADGEPNAIVTHLLMSAFGAEWKKPLEVFMEIYQDYRKQSFFK